MSEYMLYLFSIVVFLILIRESVIDIKTMYVPDNITLSIYTSALLFLFVSWLSTDSLYAVKKGLWGFLAGFGVPFIISFLGYIINLVSFKTEKNKISSSKDIPISYDKGKDKINSLEEKQKKRRITYWVFCFLFIVAVSFVQKILPQKFFLLMGIFIWILVVFLYEKTKKIDYSIYAVGIVLIAIHLIAKHDFKYLFFTIGAVVLELILAKLYKRFYKIEEEQKEEDEEDSIEGGIGGGDILIFGALGLIFGIEGVISIFFYSVFCQILVMLSYFILKGGKEAVQYCPFVPGIALGTYLYIAGIDLLNFQQVLFYLKEVL